MKNIKVYIIAFMLSILSIGLSFLSYGISVWVKAPNPFPYYIPMLVFAFIYALLAYLMGDLVYLKYKKQTGEIHPSVPIEIKEKMLVKRLPFIYALIITLLVIAGLFIASLFMKHWPLL